MAAAAAAELQRLVVEETEESSEAELSWGQNETLSQAQNGSRSRRQSRRKSRSEGEVMTSTAVRASPSVFFEGGGESAQSGATGAKGSDMDGQARMMGSAAENTDTGLTDPDDMDFQEVVAGRKRMGKWRDGKREVRGRKQK